MEPIHAIADLYSMRTTPHTQAFSALPNAPVLPYVEPRHRIRTLVAVFHRPTREPTMAVRPARYSTEC
jgi:hypothetical protein